MFEYKKHKIAICIIAIILHLTLFLAPIFQSRTLTVCDVPYTVYEPLYTTVPQIVDGKMEQVQIQIGTIPKTEYRSEVVWMETEPKSLLQVAIDGPIPSTDSLDIDFPLEFMAKGYIFLIMFFSIWLDISALKTYTGLYTKEKFLQNFNRLLAQNPSKYRWIQRAVKGFFRAPTGMLMFMFMLLPADIGLADNIYSMPPTFFLPTPLFTVYEYIILGILGATMILSIYNRIISSKQTKIVLKDIANERAKVYEEE